MIFRQLFDKESSTYTYLVGDEASGTCALIDAVRENVDRDLDLVTQLGLKLTHVFDTHVHADHVTGAGELRKRTGAITHIAAVGGPPCADVALSDGDVVNVGNLAFSVLATPGHTSACLTYRLPDRVFTGDALLIRGCGRTDFQEGDAGRLYDSVTQRIFTLPDETLIYPAHDYRGMTVTTVGEEKRFNPRLGGGTTRDAFIAKMAVVVAGLPAPSKIAEALPANRACGQSTGQST